MTSVSDTSAGGESVNHAYMARVYIGQAQHSRQHPAWHAKLLNWAADRRKKHAEALRLCTATPATTTPIQGDLFEGLL